MRRCYAYFLATLATILIAIDLGTLAAPVHRVADGLTGYRVQYLIAAASLLTLLLFTSRRGIPRAARWGLALVIVHQSYWILPTALPLTIAKTTQENPIQFSVAAFNVLHSNQATEDTLSFFRKNDPDILAFFESLNHWPDALATLTDEWPNHTRVDALDMELYSKHPIASQQTYRFGDCRGFVACELLIEEATITVIMCHPYPPITFGQAGYDWRNEQLTTLADSFANHQDPLIVMGDFNASTWSPKFRELLETTGWQRARLRPSFLGTHALIAPQTPIFAQPIDHILASPAIQILRSEIGPHLGSDHRPLYMECSVAGPEG